LTTLLTDFKTQYVGLIARYNESAKAALAHGGQPDVNLLLQQRDDLVQMTRAAMALRLSSESVSRIEGACKITRNTSNCTAKFTL